MELQELVRTTVKSNEGDGVGDKGVISSVELVEVKIVQPSLMWIGSGVDVLKIMLADLCEQVMDINYSIESMTPKIEELLMVARAARGRHQGN